MAHHLSMRELEAGLPRLEQAPADAGTLDMIVIRPTENERTTLGRCELSLRGGVHGDNWARGYAKSLPDGSPDPDVQVAMMNARCIALLAGAREQWSLAGDNLYVDFDLSTDNCPPGTQLAIGSTVLQVTAEPHNGCRKFSDRFGKDAVRFVNSDAGKRLHLRGVFARVVQDGTVSVGDRVARAESA